MASFSLRYAIAIVVLCYATAQSDYYSPFQVTVNPVPARQNLPPPNHAFATSRRSGPCSQYPGTTCMFVLLCIMSGGTSAGPCMGGLLSTCCMLPTQKPTATVPPVRRWPTITTTSSTTVAKKLETTQRLDTTEESVTSTKHSGNVTYCGIAKSKPQSRIIGGNDAMYGEFPWQAHIKLNKQQCGGVLLNNYYVLTAAHCIYQVRLSDIVIQLGVYDTQDHSRQTIHPQTFSVVEKKIHPKFQYQAAHPDRYDVALLKLNKAARYQDNVLPICLPRKDWNFQGWTGIITGWGKTDTGLGNRYGTRLLQKVDVPIISNRQCEEWHKEKGIDITISPEMMCAGYEEGQKDACVGDSGGPLMVMVNGRWVVVGLVSAGFGCAQSKQPGIYHRVPNTVDWLRKSIAS